MHLPYRLSHYDVTNTVKVSDPREVGREVCRLLRGLHSDLDLQPVLKAFETFIHAYAGNFPGYHGCDTCYHDVQHALDVVLAMARLLDGHERSVPSRSRLGPDRLRLGVICALFHDVGYLRRTEETHVHNGAELTRRHVTRSGEFLRDFLPTVGHADDAKLAQALVQYTGYEMPLDAVPVKGDKNRRLGFLLGTADLLAQMADREYPEKCRSFLYREFEACGIAGEPGSADAPPPVYSSPEDLVRKTPDFVEKTFADRLDGYFQGGYRYLERHFGGGNPYLSEIRKHLDYVRGLIRAGSLELLRRKPESVNGHVLRRTMGIRLGDPRRRRPAPLLRRPALSRARASAL